MGPVTMPTIAPSAATGRPRLGMAVVQFVDEQGEVLKTDVPTLLGVQPGQVVVVRGHGQLNEKLDLLVVTAGGIHIRK